MKEHQRYSLWRQEWKAYESLYNCKKWRQPFLETVKEGNEKVLKARLADADFFYREDRKESWIIAWRS